MMLHVHFLAARFRRYACLYWCILLVCVHIPPLWAQFPDIKMLKGKHSVEIPFLLENNFIIVEIKLNKTLPLKFIFDTGAENTILMQKELAQLMGLKFERQVKILGADLQAELSAYISRRVPLHFEQIELTKDILVFEEDYFHFERYAGMQINGILSAEAFRGYTLTIDYERQKIIVTENNFFKRPDPKQFEALPIEIFRSKPYLKVQLRNNSNDTLTTAKLLLDTGASLSLLMHNNAKSVLKMPVQVIKSKIGAGLGGALMGYVGRVSELRFGKYNLGGAIAGYQTVEDSVHNSNLMNRRDGIVGNEILSRFTIILNYDLATIFLRPNSDFKKTFEYDKSGLTIFAGGRDLDEYTIADINEHSPAHEAGLRIGDLIIGFNWLPARYYTLYQLSQKLQGRTGKKIRLRIKRNGIRLTKIFYLRDLI